MSAKDLDEPIQQKKCSECGMAHGEHEETCPGDGAAGFGRGAVLAGTILAEHYEIQSLVGEGGMSAVYKARHQLMDKDVAIKLLHAHLVSQSTTIRRFQQEAKAVSHLSHPNIIAVHDFGVSADAQPYLIMDYLEGESLADLLSREDHLSPERAINIFIQICSALEHAHAKGIIHRDMKPSNIMLVTADGEPDVVKIVDFGIAKLMPSAETEGQHLTKTGEIFGSPLYMSPEQCMGQPLDSRADIYSMGCVMYESLVGKPPFKGANMLETMYMRLTEPPPPFKSLRPDLKIPEQLESLVMTAMASEAAERFQSMEELREQLELLALGYDSGVALKLSTPRASGKFKKLVKTRRAPPAKLVAALGTALAVVTGMLVWKEAASHSQSAEHSARVRQELVWQQQEREGQKQFDQGNLEAAERLFLSAAAAAESFGESDKRLSMSLEKLGAVYQELGKQKEMEAVAERLESIRSKNPAQQLGDTESNLNELIELTLNLVPKNVRSDEWAKYHRLTEKLSHLAALCVEQKNYGRAVELLDKELEIETQTLGPESANVAMTVSSLASVYHRNLGLYDKAEPLYKRSLAIREKQLGPDHPEVAEGIENLANLYQDQGKWAPAEELYRKALDIYSKAGYNDSVEAADALTGLAGLYRVQGKFEEAEPLYKRALAIKEKALGEDHPGVASSLNNLGGLYHAQGHYAQSEPLFKKALATAETSFGPDHPVVAHILNNLAVVELKQGKLNDAESDFSRALAIRGRALPPEHPELAQSLNGLAEVCRLLGRPGDAEPLLKEALAINEKTYGKEHQEVALVLNGFGELYQSQGKNAQAEGFYKQALELRRKLLGNDNPEVAQSLTDLAGLYAAEGKYKESEPLYREALAIREKVLGPDHPDTASTLDGYGDLMMRTNRLSQGLETKGRAWWVKTRAQWPWQ